MQTSVRYDLLYLDPKLTPLPRGIDYSWLEKIQLKHRRRCSYLTLRLASISEVKPPI